LKVMKLPKSIGRLESCQQHVAVFEYCSSWVSTMGERELCIFEMGSIPGISNVFRLKVMKLRKSIPVSLCRFTSCWWHWMVLSCGKEKENVNTIHKGSRGLNKDDLRNTSFTQTKDKKKSMDVGRYGPKTVPLFAG